MALALTTEHLLLLVELIAARLFLLELLMQVSLAVCGHWCVRALVHMSSTIVGRLWPTNCSVNERVVDQVDAHIVVLRRLGVVHGGRYISLFTCCIFKKSLARIMFVTLT